MYNTPCTFSIYIIEKVTAWLEDNGGLEAMERRNVAQSDKLYGLIDSSDFWEGKVEVASRSRMNPTFTTGNADLDTTFWQNAAEAGLSGLKGHRSVGGLRASMYNAQTDEAVDALIAYMESFEQVHGTTASPLGENGSGHVDGFDDSEDIDEVVIIIDEDDNEHECAILMVIEQHGIEYAVLAPTDQLVDDDGTEIELFILTITTDENGEETFGFIEEESEYEMVKAVVSTLMESN
jgi:uncharacterized protein YrzB (UPF0473 family)